MWTLSCYFIVPPGPGVEAPDFMGRSHLSSYSPSLGVQVGLWRQAARVQIRLTLGKLLNSVFRICEVGVVGELFVVIVVRVTGDNPW